MERDCNMEVGIKRKRGRPRKSESRRSIVSSSSSGRRDEMVGQVICGVVEASFEAGYLVNVQLTTSTSTSSSSIGEDDDNNNNNLRGVVFRGDKVCPITITNDVAPHANMYLRKHVPSSTHLHNQQQHSCPLHRLNINHPTLLTNSTSPELLINNKSSLLFPNTHHHKPNPIEEDDDDYDDMQVDDNDDDVDFNPPPKNTCTTSFEDHQEQADPLSPTPQLLLNPTNSTTTTNQLFINSTTNTNNLNLELNQPPTTTTTFIESQPPKRKLMDIFSTTFNNAASVTTTTQLRQNISDPYHSTPQLLHPISTTQGRIIVDHPTTTGSTQPSTNTCSN